MQALHGEILPPSGVEYATSLNLIPGTVFQRRSNPVDGNNALPRRLGNVVVARSNHLRIYEVHEDSLPIQTVPTSTQSRKDTEAVEGEVEMDAQGEGFVNIGTIKVYLATLLDESPVSYDEEI